MSSFDELCEPRTARGLQSVMLRWEQQQPVNAVHVAWLQKPSRPADIVAAASRALERLLKSNPGRTQDQQSPIVELFDFRHVIVAPEWHGRIEAAVTDQLNTPYLPGRPLFRITVVDIPGQGQFLIFGYRHVIADARSIALLLHEIVLYLTSPTAPPPDYAATIGDENLDRLFSSEYRWRRVPAVAWNVVRELWKSLRCIRLRSSDADDLRMEFRLHHTSLPVAVLKTRCHRYGVTVNDLILAAMMEWFAQEYPGENSRRNELAAATLVDLSGRTPVPQPYVFGQCLSSFVVRVPITAEMSFEEIVRLISKQTPSCKRVSPLLLNARSFEFLAREWDLIPLARRPAHLPAVLPLLAGVSNVNLPGIVGQANGPQALRNYFRGTCVTSLLPMMLCITTIGDSCSLATTYRSAIFSPAQMDDLAAHLGRRLFDQETVQRRAAA